MSAFMGVGSLQDRLKLRSRRSANAAVRAKQVSGRTGAGGAEPELTLGLSNPEQGWLLALGHHLGKREEGSVARMSEGVSPGRLWAESGVLGQGLVPQDPGGCWRGKSRVWGLGPVEAGPVQMVGAGPVQRSVWGRAWGGAVLQAWGWGLEPELSLRQGFCRKARGGARVQGSLGGLRWGFGTPVSLVQRAARKAPAGQEQCHVPAHPPALGLTLGLHPPAADHA